MTLHPHARRTDNLLCAAQRQPDLLPLPLDPRCNRMDDLVDLLPSPSDDIDMGRGIYASDAWQYRPLHAHRRDSLELVSLGLRPDLPLVVLDHHVEHIFLLDHAIDELVEALRRG